MQVLALLQCSSIAMENCYFFIVPMLTLFLSPLYLLILSMFYKSLIKKIVSFLASLWYSFIKFYSSFFFVQVEVAVFGVVLPL
jgi:hypothetical protein